MMLQTKIIYIGDKILRKGAEECINEAIQSLTLDGNNVIDMDIKKINDVKGYQTGYHVIIKYDKPSTF